MQRYKTTEYDEASPETRGVYDDYMRTTGDSSVPIWLKSLGHSPALARGYWERAKGTLFSGNLPLPFKEMIVFIVSAKHGARYCSACHAQNVLGLDNSLVLDDLKSFVDSDEDARLPAYYKNAAFFISKAVDDSNCLTDEDYEKLLDEGFSWEEIWEIIAVIDLATMFNVYTSTLRLDLDPNYRAVI